MKKFTQIIAVLMSMAAVASCDMFQLDNFDGPDAQVTGSLVDAKTGERMGIEAAQVSSGSWWNRTTKTFGALVAIEQGWKDSDGNDVSQDQNWLVRFDGHYTNNLVFAANYKVSMKNLPCYELDNPDFTLTKGSNNLDFKVVPFCRILNPSFRYDAAAGKIIATFSVELGDASKANKVTNVALCANTQMFVGSNYFNLAKNDGGAKKRNVNAGETITLEIDTKAPSNIDLFRYTQERYLRIGAVAAGNGFNGNNYYNFSKTYKISADFSKIEEVKWDD